MESLSNCSRVDINCLVQSVKDSATILMILTSRSKYTEGVACIHNDVITNLRLPLSKIMKTKFPQSNSHLKEHLLYK